MLAHATPSAGSSEVGRAAEQLFLLCESLDADGACRMGANVKLGAPSKVTEAARCVSAHTGAAPPGATTPHLLTFVSDWYRWQSHLRRGTARASDPPHGGVAASSGGTPPRTLLAVVHRLAAVTPAAQHIVVFRAGRVVEQGRHEELLQRGGEYSRLWLAQQEPPQR